MENKSCQAVKLFEEGYNCSQAVIGAFCDELEMDIKTIMKLSSSFGGGMGRLREVCGAVTSMFIIAGLKLGYDSPNDDESKQKHYELIQMLAKRFKDENGSIICRELLGLDIKHDIPIPEKRTLEYYEKRPCARYVEHAAEIIEEVLKNEKNILEERDASK